MHATPRNKFTQREVLDWAERTWKDYASETLTDFGYGSSARLRLSMNHHGMYRVTLGSDTLYEGYEVSKAIAAYMDPRKEHHEL